MLNISPARIEEVMDECKRLGIQKFLKQHQRGSPQRYWVTSAKRPKNELYPSKAIAVVALDMPDLNGGFGHNDSACNILRRASPGYTIVLADGTPVDLGHDAAEQMQIVFDKEVAKLSETETKALAVQRIGQKVFRKALLGFWKNACPITGITDKRLLRASHIKPWAACTGKSSWRRLDPFNGLLLSAHWDAAFDARLVTFDEKGSVVFSSKLSKEARAAFGAKAAQRLTLAPEHQHYLEHHRKRFIR